MFVHLKHFKQKVQKYLQGKTPAGGHKRLILIPEETIDALSKQQEIKAATKLNIALFCFSLAGTIAGTLIGLSNDSATKGFLLVSALVLCMVFGFKELIQAQMSKAVYKILEKIKKGEID